MEKIAPVDHSVHTWIRQRWSPRAFSEKMIRDEDLKSLLEAARWAPSCFNEQPWIFIYAKRDNRNHFDNILSCLSEKNQQWAKGASILLVTGAKLTFDHNGKPNRYAWHDVGQAISYLTVQAMSLGIYCHQMAGFSRSQITKHLNMSDGFEPVAAVALGYPGNPEQLSEELRIKEMAPRFRKKQESFVFMGQFNSP